jgi:hypothetical protein
VKCWAACALVADDADFLVFFQVVLCPGTSCREAQRATQAWWRRQGRRWLNPNTNAFCQARARLPLARLQKVWWRLADRICAQAPSLPGCHGRRMLVADGTTVQTSDTTRNQAQLPQVTPQQLGCGFPLVHLVGLFCLEVGVSVQISTFSHAKIADTHSNSQSAPRFSGCP